MSLALEKATEAQAKKIISINLVVGELSGVVGDCVQFYFDAISRGTIADGAKLDDTNLLLDRIVKGAILTVSAVLVMRLARHVALEMATIRV